jgi:hypothetical protein
MGNYQLETEIKRLKQIIETQLNSAAKEIIDKEIQNILGRVKIITTQNLSDGLYHWTIQADNIEKSK